MVRDTIKPLKKNDTTCLTLLADLAAALRHNVQMQTTAATSALIAIVDPTLKRPKAYEAYNYDFRCKVQWEWDADAFSSCFKDALYPDGEFVPWSFPC
jgi:hypothetical protein